MTEKLFTGTLNKNQNKQKTKKINHGNFSIKSYVLAISCGGDSNRSPHVILWRTSGIYAKSSFNSGLL